RMVPYQTRAVADARQVNAAVPHAEGPETAAQALERVTAHADAELPRRSGHEAGLHRRHGRQPTGPGRRCDLGSARPWLRMEGPPHPLCGQDDHLPVVPFAMAPGRNGRVALQGQMHHASLPGAHRAERDGPPRLFRFLGEPPRQLGQMLGSPPPIVFDVNHHPAREPILAAYDQIHDVLESVEGLPPPAYEHALAIATHLEHDSIRVRARSHLDGAGDTKAREDILEG